MTEYRKVFNEELLSLRKLVVDMLSQVKKHYRIIYDALETQNYKGVSKLIAADEIINDYEDDINEKAYLIILKECPVARDLRIVLTAIRIASDLERLGDYMTNIAVYIEKTKTEIHYRKYLMEYFTPIFKMMDNLKDAYINNSANVAYNAIEVDSEIDEIYEKHVKRFIKILKREIDVTAEESGRILFVIKQLERSGDHLTNIAEAIIYLVRAQRVTLN